MKHKLSLYDKIMELPFGVTVAILIIVVVILATIIIIAAVLLKINASLFFVSLLVVFAVVRLLYFGICHK